MSKRTLIFNVYLKKDFESCFIVIILQSFVIFVSKILQWHASDSKKTQCMAINSETQFNLRSNFQIKQYNSIHPTTWAKPNQENVTFLNPPSPLPPLTEMSFNSFCKFDKKIARRTNINFLNKSKKQNLPLKFWFRYINIPCFFFITTRFLSSMFRQYVKVNC